MESERMIFVAQLEIRVCKDGQIQDKPRIRSLLADNHNGETSDWNYQIFPTPFLNAIKTHIN